MPHKRVVIIGAGAAGLASAWHLLDEDPELSVTVLESNSPGSGSTSRSIGVVETQYIGDFDIAVRAYGRRFFDMLSDKHDLRFVRTGYVRLASKESDFADYQLSIARQNAHGVHDARVLTAEEVEALIPQISMTGRLGGLYGPSDGYVDGHLYSALLTELVTQMGGTVVLNAKVTAASQDADGVFTLVTSRGNFEADVVVNAAGGWAGKVGELLGAPVPLIPQRHSAAIVEVGADLANMVPMVMDYVPGSGRPGLYFRFERPDQLAAGLHIEEPVDEPADPDSYVETGSDEFVLELAEQLSERLPHLASAGIGRSWSGIYPMTPDHAPIVGLHPDNPAVICALGGGGNGIQLSPAMGRAVAETVVNGVVTSLGEHNPWDAARLGTSR